MRMIDDDIFGGFVTNSLTQSEMEATEKVLIQNGEAEASLLASIGYYKINLDLANDLLGEDDFFNDHIDRNIYHTDSIQSNKLKCNDMGRKVSPCVTAAAAIAGQKLVHLYRTKGFDFFKNSNVANNINQLMDKDNSSIQESAGGIGFAQAETNYGLPSLDIEFDPNTYQYYPDTCAFKSQALILNNFGFDVNQEDLMAIAKEQGWYVEGYGTPKDKVGKMIEHFGVGTSYTEGNNVFNLANELSQKHQILVTVDSGELWSPGLGEKLEDLILQKPDHALLVVGIDTSNPDDVKVIVTDPGNGNTQYSYSERQFMDAWKDSNCFMVSTDESPEEFAHHSVLPPMDSFASIPYETISRISDSSIDIQDSEYDAFFGELLNSPDDYDSLYDKYSNLFDDEDYDDENNNDE